MDSALATPSAVIFDFNGTLSNDEPLICGIFVDLFAERGRPLSRETYFSQLAGLSDSDIVRARLGREYGGVDEVVGERVRRYLLAAGDGSTVASPVREAVRYAAARVPVGVVSSAIREEIDAVLAGAGLADAVDAIVSLEDVETAKPAPDAYVRALELLGCDAPEDAVAFEDTEVGIAAAQAAGVRCIAVSGTLPPDRLAAADEVVPGVDVRLMQRLLG
jgi:beta-phosphoglucomutase-like phosphatase (HAD superfamily)